jgi:small conductance mechanosensitive channel
MEATIESIKSFFKDFLSGSGVSLARALAILVVGLILTRLIASIVRSFTIKSRNLDNSASSFITALVKVVLYAIVIIIVLGTAGVDTASLIAAFAAVSLAICLGLQDTLAGLANGILIIFTKPFKQGDYVSIGGTEGTIKEIHLFNTKLTTPDNLDIIIPNASVLSSNITNYSSMPLRRVDIDLPMPYDSKVDTVKETVLTYLTKDKRIVEVPAPVCRLKTYGDNAVIYTVRAWVRNGEYWDVRFDLMEGLAPLMKEKGLSVPYPQMDVHIIRDDEKEDRV